MLDTLVMRSPLGNIKLVAEEEKLISLQFTEESFSLDISSKFLLHVREQVNSYLNGDLRHFHVPTQVHGSAFQEEVWKWVRQVGYGKTASYHQLAALMHNPGAVRAVGAANGANPILIITPCHRIISKTGQLTGYAGGLWRKVKLLQLEARDQPGNQYSLGF
jgi:methylated-DNA-[protein]-cysteine S-methyltransferase